MRAEHLIAIAAGDPAGVGPRVSVAAALSMRERVRTAIFGDLRQLREEAQMLGFDPSILVEHDEASLVRDELSRGCVAAVDTGTVPPHVIARHAPTPEGGLSQLRTLERAARFVQEGKARALVTGPTSKAAVVSSGHAFVGQTELLARLDGREPDAVTMLFLGPRLRVGLVTTHLAMVDVPSAITEEHVMRTARHLSEALLRLVPGVPRVAVSGLNPHAGEAGIFGEEEKRVIGPAIDRLRATAPFREGRVVLSGPMPAEVVFRAAQAGEVHGVVAMFHDQATIASKLLDWGSAVNTTWGLSFLRTSVDHGVGYEAARSRRIDPDGMMAALKLAVRLTGAADD